MDYNQNRTVDAAVTDLVPNIDTISDDDIFFIPDDNLRDTSNPLFLLFALEMPDGHADKTANIDIYHYDNTRAKWFLYQSFVDIENLNTISLGAFVGKYFVHISSTTLLSGNITIVGGCGVNINGKMIFEADNILIENIDIEKIGGSPISLGRTSESASLPVALDNEAFAALQDIAGISSELEKLTGAAAITAATGTITFAKKTKITRMELHLSGNPTTNEDFLITKDDADDPVYDIVKFKSDLSIPASDPVTDITQPFDDVVMVGDKWVVTWPNSESLTYGLTLFGIELE